MSESTASDGQLTDDITVTVDILDYDYTLQNPPDLSPYFELRGDDWRIWTNLLIKTFGGTELYLNFTELSYEFGDGQAIEAGHGLLVGGNDLSVFTIPSMPAGIDDVFYYSWDVDIDDHVIFPASIPDEIRINWSPGNDEYILPDLSTRAHSINDNRFIAENFYSKQELDGIANPLGITADNSGSSLTVSSDYGSIVVAEISRFFDSSGDDTFIGGDHSENFTLERGGSDTVTTGLGADEIRIEYSSENGNYHVAVTDINETDKVTLSGMGFSESQYLDQLAITYDFNNSITHVSVFTDTYTQSNLISFQDIIFPAIAWNGSGEVRLRDFKDSAIQRGSAENDRLYGLLVDDEIYGGDGNDRLYASTGDDILDGGDGFDTLDLRDFSSDVTVNLTTGVASGSEIGTDQVSGFEAISSGSGNDVLIGKEQTEFTGGEYSYFSVTDIYGTWVDTSFSSGGGLGDDYIEGPGDFDYVGYQISDTAVSIDLESGRVIGGLGTDTLVDIEYVTGSNYGDQIYGSSGDDFISPDHLAADYLPNDRIGGVDHIDGRGGIDTLVIGNGLEDNNRTFFTANIVDMQAGTAIDMAGNVDTFVNIENVITSELSDTVTDDSGDNAFQLLEGNDTATVSGGADLVVAGDGLDVINLASPILWDHGFYAKNVDQQGAIGTNKIVSLAGKVNSSTVIHGGNEEDTLNLTASDDAFFLHDSFSKFNSWVSLAIDSEGQRNHARLIDVEVINAGAGDDIIDMTSSDYSTSSINMAIDGGDGNDVIWAGQGADTLMGGNGDDILNGSSGNDQLTGGAGKDIFEFTSTSGNDRITDFHGLLDEIHLFYRKDSVEEGLMASINNQGVLSWGEVTIDLGIENAGLNVDQLNIVYEVA